MAAYCYVKQALVANELLMKHLKRVVPAVSATDCLLEAPMELCAEQHVKVKMETEDEEDVSANDVRIACSELTEPDEHDVENKKSVDPLTMIDSVKMETDPSSVNYAVEGEFITDVEDEEWVSDMYSLFLLLMFIIVLFISVPWTTCPSLKELKNGKRAGIPYSSATIAPGNSSNQST